LLNAIDIYKQEKTDCQEQNNQSSVQKNHSQNLDFAFQVIDSSYLEHIGLTGGGTQTACGKSYVTLEKEKENYGLRMYCYSIGCPECSKINGRIHKKRKNKLYELVKDKGFYQLVFTVPKHLRELLKSRDMIKKYKRLCMKIIKDYFHDEIGFIFYLHLKGDKNEKEFNPHCNFHILTNKQELKLEKEFIELIKERYKRAMRALLKEKIDKIDVHFSFVPKNAKASIKRHRIKYMSNPEKNKYYDEFHGGDVYMKRFKNVEIYKNKKYEDIDENPLEQLKKQGYKVVGFVNASVFENVFEVPDDDKVFKLKTRSGLSVSETIELLNKNGLLKK